MPWYRYCFEPYRKYATFSGRATRMEFWMFLLLFLFGDFVAVYIDISIGTYNLESEYGYLQIIFSFASLLPGLGVIVRRFHDMGRDGAWVLLIFVPFLGLIALLIFMAMPSQKGDNRYGLDPFSPQASVFD